MRFPERAVKNCVKAIEENRLGRRHVSDVLRYDDINIESIEKFLFHKDAFVRKSVAEIITLKSGNVEKLIELAKVEKEKYVLIILLKYLIGEKHIEKLADFLCSKTPAIRGKAIEMFRRSKRADCLLPLIFEEDECFVQKIKKYIEEIDCEEKSN